MPPSKVHVPVWLPASVKLGAERQTAADRRQVTGHARDRTRQVVLRRVIRPAVGRDRDNGVRLGDGDRRRAALVEVVRATFEGPACRCGCPAFGEARPEGQTAADRREVAGHARDRARQVVCRRVIRPAVGRDRDIGVRLGDGDRRRAALVEVVGATLEGPRARVVAGVGEARRRTSDCCRPRSDRRPRP